MRSSTERAPQTLSMHHHASLNVTTRSCPSHALDRLKAEWTENSDLHQLIIDQQADLQSHPNYIFVNKELHYKGQLVVAFTSLLTIGILSEFHTTNSRSFRSSKNCTNRPLVLPVTEIKKAVENSWISVTCAYITRAKQ